jgi:hypothetical protein
LDPKPVPVIKVSRLLSALDDSSFHRYPIPRTVDVCTSTVEQEDVGMVQDAQNSCPPPHGHFSYHGDAHQERWSQGNFSFFL